jgi:Helix-turn-helix domain
MTFHADNPGRNRILNLLRAHEGDWIPLPAILHLGVAQYNARIKQLRDEGHLIENKISWEGKTKKSWFRYQGKRT